MVRERIHRDSELLVLLQRAGRELILPRSGGEHKQPRQVLEHRADGDAVRRMRVADLLPQAVRSSSSWCGLRGSRARSPGSSSTSESFRNVDTPLPAMESELVL